MIKGKNIIKPPSSKEKLALRIMISIGFVGFIVFFIELFNLRNTGHPFLYVLFMISFIYMALRMIMEWYYYFSISIPKKPIASIHKTVDIFTTFCPGEPYEMIIETLTAIQNINYPHTTYLCDEANDDYLRKLCKDMGVIHVTRNNRINAKAGNINNALKQAKGELCVILDPDHVPVPEFLDSVVTYFDDEKIGYVQIVQAYKNSSDSLIAKGAAQQTYQFYGPMMMCMNTYGTVQAIGANCTFRRSALDSIGGHAAGLAEDMHTSMKLQAKGWKSVYVPEVLTRGLVPSTLSAYYKQQLKWAKGTFDLFVTSYPKIFRNFTFRQKVHYGILPLNYINGVIFLINFIIPILSLVLSIIPLKMDMINFVLYSYPILLAHIFIRLFVQRWVMEEKERGIHMVGGLLQIGTWWIYVLALFYRIIGKNVPYDPTPKDGKEENNWPLNIPNIVVIILSLGAIAYGLYIDYNPFILFMAMLAFLNALILIFVVLISRQESFNRFKKKNKRVQKTVRYLSIGKSKFWLFRHFVYSILRKTAFPMLIISCAIIIYILTFYEKNKFEDDNLYALILDGWKNDSNHYTQSESNYTLPVDGFELSPQNINRKSFNLPITNGVNYYKGLSWFRNYHTLTRQVVEADFELMKKSGIQSIKRIGPEIYDRTVLRIAKKKGLTVNYSFWIPDDIDFINDESRLNHLRNKIISTVKKYKKLEVINSWNISPDIFSSIATSNETKDKIQQQQRYLAWLLALTNEINKVDSLRPLSIDVNINDYTTYQANIYKQFFNAINAIGIVEEDTLVCDLSDCKSIEIPWYFSHITTSEISKANQLNKSVYINSWQDRMTKYYVTFDGVVDHWGLPKIEYYSMKNEFAGTTKPISKDNYKILKPAQEMAAGNKVTFSVLKKNEKNWSILQPTEKQIHIEWYLIQTDVYGNPLHMKYMGNDFKLTLKVPDFPKLHNLYLVISNDSLSTGIRDKLYTSMN